MFICFVTLYNYILQHKPYMTRLFLFICCFGVASLLRAQSLPDLIPYQDSTLWGYADTNGNVVVRPQWLAVSFFNGNRAKVRSDTFSKGSPQHYSIIDKQGNYILPPSRRWNGGYTGWSSMLNCSNEYGQWGLVDTNNNLLINCEWDAPTYSSVLLPKGLADSCHIVHKNGLCGLLNRKGKLLITNKYSSISAADEMWDKTGMLLVTDPDNVGRNNKGIVDIYGKEYTPLRYSDVVYTENKKHKGFICKTAIDNDPMSGNSEFRTTWLNYPSMKAGAMPKDILTYYEPEVRMNGYILKGQPPRYIADTNGKVLFADTYIERINGDTIVNMKRKHISDTLTIVRSYLSAATLQPLAPPQLQLLYLQQPVEVDPFNRGNVCGYGASQAARMRALIPDVPEIYVEYMKIKSFYKDSFLFSIQRYVGNIALPYRDLYKHYPVVAPRNMLSYYEDMIIPGQLYLVTGNVRNYYYGKKSCNAIVDESLRYVVPPIKNTQILAYNRANELLTLSKLGHDKDGWAQHVGVTNLKGDTLVRFRNWDLAGAYKMNNKIYVLKITKQEIPRSIPAERYNSLNFEERYYRYYTQAADTSGEVLSSWKRYTVTGVLPEGLLPSGQTGFYVQDTNHTIAQQSSGMLTPDGSVLFPKISFKYRTISYEGCNMFIVQDSTSKRLLDLNGRDLLVGKKVHQVKVAEDLIQPMQRWAAKEEHSRLRLVTATLGSDKYYSFYVDDKGRAYTSLLKKKK